MTSLNPANDWCQRWTPLAVPTWRHRSEGGFDARRYTVTAISEAEAKRFIRIWHYSGTMPAAKHRYGLTDLATGRLVGVAVYGVPVQRSVLTNPFPELQPYVESVELSRFVLADEVPANAESWTLARTFRLLREQGVRGVVSFSDPMPRRNQHGIEVLCGHIGGIYQASNAIYTGRGTARTLTLLGDGTVLNDRSAQKVRRQETGHAYVEARLEELGARPMTSLDDPAAWLTQALRTVGATKLRHKGAHRYLFPLGSTRKDRHRIRLGYEPQTYPKQLDTPEVA
jgi:hypothetical protein